MGDWDVSCAMCGVIFAPRLVEIESENGPSPEEPEYQRNFRYDRTKITKADLQWLPENNALGLWPESPGSPKSYFTGNFFGSDYGSVTLLEMDGIPSYIEEIEQDMVTYPCVMGGVAVFPFHKACYGLLTRAITRNSEALIDEEILYSAFVQLGDENETWHLAIDYGDPPPRDNRAWLSMAGHELLVKNPVEKADISTYLQPRLPPALSRSWNALQDPFGRLPSEIRQQLLELLPLRDLSALKTASYPMHVTVPSKAVWHGVFSAIMPWLWEMEDVLSRGEHTGLDLFGTIRELQRRTKFSADTDHLCLTLANRRRVWAVCEMIADVYDELLESTDSTREWSKRNDGCFELN